MIYFIEPFQGKPPLDETRIWDMFYYPLNQLTLGWHIARYKKENTPSLYRNGRARSWLYL